MNATVKEWISKAEGDYRTAEWELQTPTGPPNSSTLSASTPSNVPRN